MDKILPATREIVPKGVKEIFFSLREDFITLDPTRIVKIELYHTLGVNIEFKHVKFMLGLFVHYVNVTDKLVEIQVNNFFQLPNMDNYEMEGNDIILPGGVLFDIVRESVAHTRALLCVRLSGTPLSEVVIPFDDPLQITNHFFPGLIRTQEGIFSKIKGKLDD